MRTSDFDYNLPKDLIAQAPAPRREDARLLVYRRVSGAVRHRRVHELPQLIPSGSIVVFNDTKVLPARLYGRKKSGGRVELLLLGPAPEGENRYHALGRAGRGLSVGERVFLREELTAQVEERGEGGRILVRIHGPDKIRERLERAGVMPLPPYIRRGKEEDGTLDGMDRERYQTVYARVPGAVAAPTAGLHFTKDILDGLDLRGIRRVSITLHVGPGTFQPVRSEDPDRHVMHEESYLVPEETAERVNRGKEEGAFLLAVGTTSCRTLEAACCGGRLVPGAGTTNLFIRPGARFRLVDGLLTNFHLPRSTLLMLVCALVGREKTLDLYAEAIRRGYRFYSYGDAMLVL